jgi:M6 family metalloprotease-like protein
MIRTILFLLVLPSGVLSFVPPSSSNANENAQKQWESVHPYRERRGLAYGYEPKLLSPELCRDVTEAECEEMDTTFQELALRNRNFQIQQVNDVFKVLVIPLAWSNHADRSLIDVAELRELWNGEGVSTVIPSGSIANWTTVNSHDNIQIEATVVDWIMTDNTESFYADGRSAIPSGSDSTPDISEAFTPLLKQLDSEGFDFGEFDQNFDAKIDVVVFLHSGYAAELGGADCTTGATTFDRIQSFAKGGPIDSWESSSGIQLGSYVIASAFRGTCNSNIARLGVITHEFMHTFGLSDLYDLGGKLNSVGVGGLSGYDIM